VPRVKISEIEEKNRVVKSIIAKNMELHGMTDEDVAAKLHCTKRTFQNKKKRPETFVLSELRKLSITLKFSDEEKAMLI